MKKVMNMMQRKGQRCSPRVEEVEGSRPILRPLQPFAQLAPASYILTLWILG